MWLQNRRSSQVGKWHFLLETGWPVNHLRRLFGDCSIFWVWLFIAILGAQTAQIRHITFLNFGNQTSTKHFHLCIYQFVLHPLARINTTVLFMHSWLNPCIFPYMTQKRYQTDSLWTTKKNGALSHFYPTFPPRAQGGTPFPISLWPCLQA